MNIKISGLSEREVGECASELFQAVSTDSGVPSVEVTPDMLKAYCEARLTMHTEQALNYVGVST